MLRDNPKYGNTAPLNHVIFELADTRSESLVECSEFLSRFSEFCDAQTESRLRRRVEAHLEHCEKCARYERTVASGTALLQTLPRVTVSESFRPTLEHRLLHLEDENALARTAAASAVPVLTAVAMAIVLAIIAWSPTLGRSTAEVNLAPIVVSGPPSREPALVTGTRSFAPWKPALSLETGLWSDSNALLYEYSPMRERYRAEGLLRRTGSGF